RRTRPHRPGRTGQLRPARARAAAPVPGRGTERGPRTDPLPGGALRGGRPLPQRGEPLPGRRRRRGRRAAHPAARLPLGDGRPVALPRPAQPLRQRPGPHPAGLPGRGGGPGPMTPLRIGVLGCADIALRRVLPALAAAPEWETVAVASRDPEKAKRTAQRFGCRPVRGYRALLDLDELDAVYVPLPAAL